MTAVTYTAERELAPGHSQGTDYTIDVRLIALKPGKDVRKTESKSMSGVARETITLRNLNTRQAISAALVGTELDLMREFLESTIEGEQFTFDEFGTAAAADDPLAATISGVYREERALRQGDGGAADHFRFTFEIDFF